MSSAHGGRDVEVVDPPFGQNRCGVWPISIWNAQSPSLTTANKRIEPPKQIKVCRLAMIHTSSTRLIFRTGVDHSVGLARAPVLPCLTTGANNQLQGGYTYDAAGNMLHDATANLNYTYDRDVIRASRRHLGARGEPITTMPVAPERTRRTDPRNRASMQRHWAGPRPWSTGRKD